MESKNDTQKNHSIAKQAKESENKIVTKKCY